MNWKKKKNGCNVMSTEMALQLAAAPWTDAYVWSELGTYIEQELDRFCVYSWLNYFILNMLLHGPLVILLWLTQWTQRFSTANQRFSSPAFSYNIFEFKDLVEFLHLKYGQEHFYTRFQRRSWRTRRNNLVSFTSLPRRKQCD